MKKLFFLLLMMVSVVCAWAQEPYCCITQGAVLTYTEYDADGKEAGTTKQTYKEVKGSGDNYDVAILAEVNAGGTVTNMDMNMSVKDGGAQINIGTGTIDVTATDMEMLTIPNKLAVGYQLPLGEMIVNVGGLRVKSTITENEVIDREEITTPAGTFKCYVVKQVSESRVFGMKTNAMQKIWVARGIGNVKTENYSSGKLVSTSILTSLVK